jgi:hypothetical protein
MAEATTRFNPETSTRTMVATVEPAMVVRSGPTDMLLKFREMLSRKETFFTRPVLSRANTV